MKSPQAKFTIWKFELYLTGTQLIKMPKNTRLLSVATQRGVLQLWGMVAVGSPEVSRRINIIGTGHPVGASDGVFIGTVLTEVEALVWHVFDGGEV